MAEEARKEEIPRLDGRKGIIDLTQSVIRLRGRERKIRRATRARKRGKKRKIDRSLGRHARNFPIPERINGDRHAREHLEKGGLASLAMLHGLAAPLEGLIVLDGLPDVGLLVACHEEREGVSL